MSHPRDDGDAIAEAVARMVQLDGSATRCPWLFCRLFSIRIRPLCKGRLHGYFSARRRTIYIDVSGTPEEVRARLAHEIGHAMLFLLRYQFPHDEELASRAGRAWCLGRRAVLFALRELRREEAIAHYSSILPPGEVSARIWEVQRAVMRWVG